MSAKPVAPKVCLVISSFRNDESVMRIIDSVSAEASNPFFRIIVVDSLGTGKMPGLIERSKWPNVEYHCSESNLGSAGNLAKRLQLAADAGADHAYAVNHDGQVDPGTVEKLLAHLAKAGDDVGAIYPLRRFANLDNKSDLAGARLLSLGPLGRSSSPRSTLVEVYWSSSNGALYSMEPVRLGLLPWGDLWMGWEDMGYGWLLGERGYRQYIATDVVTSDNYEFRSAQRWGLPVRLSDKPAWYAYYHARNLVLLARRTGRAGARASAAARIVAEFGASALMRPNPVTRCQYLAAGVLDGVAGKTGKWRLP